MSLVAGSPPPVARPEVLRAYWHLAAERQRIFMHRLAGQPGPWTDDPILGEYRFCNSYRASDRVSQFLIRDVVYRPLPELTSEDVLLRTILFRLFSREPTWTELERRVGRITAADFDPQRYGDALEEMMGERMTLYTSAFILCANDAYGYPRKHRNHMALLEHMMGRGGLPRSVATAGSMRELYTALSEFPLIGPFMAYQLATDINYTPLTDFSEQSFTVAGPGAVRGIRKVFEDRGGWSDAQIIHYMADTQEEQCASFGIEPPTLWGRRLQAIDCQNLFCETDKYCRVAFPQLASNRSKIKQRFREQTQPPAPFYPPKWGLSGEGLSRTP